MCREPPRAGGRSRARVLCIAISEVAFKSVSVFLQFLFCLTRISCFLFLLLLLFIAARESYSVPRQEDVHENIESSIWRILLHGTRLVALSCRFDMLLSSCMLPAYIGVNLHRSFQTVSSVPRGTSARPLQSFARNNPLSLPSPFCIRFVSVFFHPKLNVCKQDL
jgi:hypothetical protein